VIHIVKNDIKMKYTTYFTEREILEFLDKNNKYLFTSKEIFKNIKLTTKRRLTEILAKLEKEGKIFVEDRIGKKGFAQEKKYKSKSLLM